MTTTVTTTTVQEVTITVSCPDGSTITLDELVSKLLIKDGSEITDASHLVLGMLGGDSVDLGLLPGATRAGLSWTSSSMPSGSIYTSVTYGGGQFVVTGLSGWVMTSPDAVNWTSRTGSGDLSGGVAYGNGLYVAVEQFGTHYATSPDGVTWTSRTLPASTYPNNTHAVLFGNGKFVIGGGGTTAMYSSDGITWSTATLPVSVAPYTIAFGNGLFILPDFSSTNAVISDDGVTWTAITTTESGQKRAAAGNDLFVIINSSGSPSVSADNGATWTNLGALSGGTNFADLVFGGGRFLAVPSGYGNQVYTSRDGMAWDAHTLPVSAHWWSAWYGNESFVVVAQEGTVALSSSW